MTTEIDITPKTHILTSMSRQDMAPSLAIVELLDNSLDAKKANGYPISMVAVRI